MSAQQSEDLARIRETIGDDFDFIPVNETLSDAASEDLSADARTPSLSVLKKNRLGSECRSNPNSRLQSDSRDDLFQRFSHTEQDAAVETDHDPAVETNQESAPNRVYLKRSKAEADLTEAFAPKPIVVSGTTGKITERG